MKLILILLKSHNQSINNESPIFFYYERFDFKKLNKYLEKLYTLTFCLGNDHHYKKIFILYNIIYRSNIKFYIES